MSGEVTQLQICLVGGAGKRSSTRLPEVGSQKHSIGSQGQVWLYAPRGDLKFNTTSMSSTRFRNTLVWATWDSRTWLNVEPKISLHRFVGKPYTLHNAAHLSFLKWILTLPRPLAVPQSQVRESAERLSKMRFKLVGAHGLGLLS